MIGEIVAERGLNVKSNESVTVMIKGVWTHFWREEAETAVHNIQAALSGLSSPMPSKAGKCPECALIGGHHASWCSRTADSSGQSGRSLDSYARHDHGCTSYYNMTRNESLCNCGLTALRALLFTSDAKVKP